PRPLRVLGGDVGTGDDGDQIGDVGHGETVRRAVIARLEGGHAEGPRASRRPRTARDGPRAAGRSPAVARVTGPRRSAVPAPVGNVDVVSRRTHVTFWGVR